MTWLFKIGISLALKLFGKNTCALRVWEGYWTGGVNWLSNELGSEYGDIGIEFEATDCGELWL